jgi:hypothetical protein
MSVRSQLFVVLATALWIAASAAGVSAQKSKKPHGESFHGKGVIESSGGDEIKMTTADGDSLVLKIAKSGGVHVTGIVAPEELHHAKNVQVIALFDKKTRRIKDPVKKVTIFTPTKDQPAGVLPDTSAKVDDDSIDLHANWKPCIIGGSVQTLSGQKLTLNVPGLTPARLKVELADDFQVSVDVTDIHMVKAGDKIDVRKAIKTDDGVIHVMEATIRLAKPKKPKAE